MDVGNETLEFDSNPEHNNYKPWSDSEPYRYPCDGPAPKFEGYADPSFQSNQKQKKEEPLFVLDTSQNFQLDFEIQYETPKSSKNNDNSSTRSNNGPRQNACWNCNSTQHALHNCPQYKDHRAIARNRQAFLKNKQQQQLTQQNQPYSRGRNFRNRSGAQRFTRYFVEKNPDQQFSDFTPGKLSKELLLALGVSENQIPSHVYKMREHGYPSGWLEDAKIDYSGISIYTAPNKRVPLPGRENEEDDIFNCRINEKKLHEYPGFNAPFPSDCIDESKSLGYLEFNPEHSIKNMCKRLKVNKVMNPYKRTKLTEFPKSISLSEDTGFGSNSNETLNTEQIWRPKSTDVERSYDHPPSSPEEGEIFDEEEIIEDDMEYVECPFTNTLESSSEEMLPPLVIDEQYNSEAVGSSDEAKESLTQLETSTSNSMYDSINETKERIDETKESLNDTQLETTTSESMYESIIDIKESIDKTEKSINETKVSLNDSQSEANISISTNSGLVSSETPTSSNKSNDLKNETLGTPVLKRFSAFVNRPSHGSFSKGMVDMIDHENLPNATGTFSKIKELLKYVRKKLESES